MRDRILRALIRAFIAAVVIGASHANACSIPPGPAKTERAFERMLEDGDYIFIGRVSHVLRRRWGDDDTHPRFHMKWLEYAERAQAGEDVGSHEYIVNWVEFAEATAFILVETELYRPELTHNYYGIPWKTIPIDLLRPFTVAGHGPCHNFPRTCPWDIEPEETLVLAVEKNEFGAQKALFRRRVSRLTQDERREAYDRSRTVTKFDSIRRYYTPYPHQAYTSPGDSSE
jgi:hypothetical protein